MPIPVWTFATHYPLPRKRLVDRIRTDLGVGFAKTVIKTPTATRADGQGTISSYRAQNVFGPLTVLRKNFDGDNQAKDVIAFLQLRVDNGDEAFYFYYPDELVTPDPTGVNTTGRYLVKFLGDISDVLTHLKRHDFHGLIFEEAL